MSLEKNRDVLLDLPFTGLKLDRHLVDATRHSRRARAEIERLVAMAHARGMLVTAEGVTDAALWQASRGPGLTIRRVSPSAAPFWRRPIRPGLPPDAARGVRSAARRTERGAERTAA